MDWTDVVSHAISILIGGGIAVLSSALTDRRAERRSEQERSHDAAVRAEQRAHDRRDRAEEMARTRVTALLAEYQERYAARLTYREQGEDGRGDWVERTSSDSATALLIPQQDAREALLSVVNYIGEMSNSYHGRAILGPHDSYGNAMFEAITLGRDVCAQWLREGEIEAATRESVRELDARYAAWLPESGGPEPPGGMLDDGE